MNITKIRLRMKRKRPAFKRANWRTARVGTAWRRPKGLQSKLRQHQKSHGWRPQPGYGSPAAVRGRHPSGLFEVMVSSPAQLAGLDPSTSAVRISGGVGGLKRHAIQAVAQSAGLVVLNPKKITIRQKPKAGQKAEETGK